MKFWVTTHWPPRENDESPPSGVWVADGREEAGKELRKGDCVLICQTGGGPVVLRDIVLEDHAGRIIGLEIEVTVDPTEVAGILQAIKYRHLLAFVKLCRYEETRSFPVAHAITRELRNICKLYSVECFVISREDVRRWKSGRH